MSFWDCYYTPRIVLKVRVFPGLSRMGLMKRLAVECRWRRKGYRLVEASS
jgi:hypothetical protein